MVTGAVAGNISTEATTPIGNTFFEATRGGWNRDAIERQLAHGERDAVRAAYNYAQHLPERRKMMQAWADYLDQLKAEEPNAKTRMKRSDPKANGEVREPLAAYA